MNKFAIIIFLLANMNLFAQTTYVPDNNFEQALIDLGHDDVLDDYVLTLNISAITTLNIDNKNISDLTGIESFTALTYLMCQNNQLSNINISTNAFLISLTCNDNQLTNLDITLNTNLEWLFCENNQITNLDVLNNTALIYLSCGNNLLTNLDVSQNIVLEWLICNDNQLTSIDASQNTALTKLYCLENQLSDLNVQNGNNNNIVDFFAQANPNLSCIFIDDKNATYLSDWTIDAASTFVETEAECFLITHTYVPDDNFEQALIDLGHDDVLDDYVLTSNICGITHLAIINKSISDLTGISGFTSLFDLSCSQNQLTSLDVSANTSLYYLSCHSNQLTSLDVSVTTLNSLWCFDNQLTSLDLSANTALSTLRCYANQLTSLDVSVTSLTSLSCYDNQLTSLDVSVNTALIYLHCFDNQLTSLDVSANTALTDLFCFQNQLTSMDVSANTALTYLYCFENQLTSLDVRTGNNANFIYFNATSNPNLKCIFVDDATWSTTNWTSIDTTSTFVETEAECDALVNVNDVLDNDFAIYPNPTKENFKINTNHKIENIKVYDVFGKLIIKYNKQDTYPVSNLTTGVYLIHVESETGSKISKLVVE